MALPPDLARLRSIRDFLDWRRAVEKLLADIDTRIASRHLSQAGIAYLWTGSGAPPPGHLLADGHLVFTVSHQELHAALGYPGGGGATTFNVPNLSGAPSGGVWVVRG